MNPSVFYVGQRVLVWIDYQGWLPATLTRVHPGFIAHRDGIAFPEPFRREHICRQEPLTSQGA